MKVDWVDVPGVTWQHKMIGGRQVMFTTDQAKKCFPNGTRFKKIRDHAGDAHKAGSTGQIIGSIRFVDRAVYFVYWDEHPDVPVTIAENAIMPLDVGSLPG